MMYKEDIRFKQLKESLIADKSISKKNKDHIFTFLDELSAQGLSIARIQKYCYYLTRIVKTLKKDFSKVNKDDIVDLLNEIEKMKVRAGGRAGKPLSDWSKHDYRIVIKRFFKWLREKEGQSFGVREYPDEVKWFSVNIPKSKRRKPRNLLKVEDIEALVDAATNVRNKLFVRLSYETGARIGELLSLTLDGIEWDEHGATVQIFGKTGERKIRIIDSVPLLSAWLREHPKVEEIKTKKGVTELVKKDNNALLFCGLHGSDPGYNYFRIMLHRLGKKAGIKKPMNPHHFRHSRATELSKYLTEAQLCQYMGWVPGSSQTATYVHLSGRDLDSAILKMKGIKIQEEVEEEKKQPITCPKCKTVNDSLAKWCINCGLGLDPKTMMDYQKKKEKAAKTGFEVDAVLDDRQTLINTIESMGKRLEELEKQVNKK